MFNLKPSKVVGELKDSIKEAIIEGEIHNDREEAMKLLLTIAKKRGLTPVSD
jgi:hypothetical protein